MNADRFLTVEGDHLTDATGKTVALRGYNIGGFLNMENFLTGFPSTESLQRGALLRALGEKRYELYFDRFMAAFFSDDDARYLASLGMNHVRVPFNYRHFEDDDRPFELKESGFACSRAWSPFASATISTPSSTCTRCRAARTWTGTATTRRITRSSGCTVTSRTAWSISGKSSPTDTRAVPRSQATTLRKLPHDRPRHLPSLIDRPAAQHCATTPESCDAGIAVNLKHQFFAAQAVIADMRQAGGGSIVNFGSISWKLEQGGMPVYTTAKAAVQGLTRSLAWSTRAGHEGGAARTTPK